MVAATAGSGVDAANGRPATADPAELARLRVTVAGQTAHIERLLQQVEGLTARVAETRSLLHAAHEQLLQRDLELERRRQRESDLQSVARDRDRIIVARDEAIAWLQGLLAHRDHLIATRDEMVNLLKRDLSEARKRVGWGSGKG